jgi:reverse gyrase
MSSYKSGNSMMPTDAQYDAYFAKRCEDCGEKLTDSECHADGVCEACLEKREEELEQDQ